MTSLHGELVAQAIREHQIEASGPWEYRDLVKDLHVCVESLDREFELDLPIPIIAIAELPWNILGRYRLGRNQLGVRTNIALNEIWSPYRSFAETLITLVHELLHAFEEWRLGREKGGWYHTKAWRDKMEEVGIIADDHGITMRVCLVSSSTSDAMEFNTCSHSDQVQRVVRCRSSGIRRSSGYAVARQGIPCAACT